MAGDHNHRQIGVECDHLRQYFKAGAAGQAHIGHDHASKTGMQPRLCLFRAGAGVHREGAQFQRLRSRLAHRVFIFDQHRFKRRHTGFH